MIKIELLIPVIFLSIAYLVTQLSSHQVLNAEDIKFNGYYFISSTFSILFLIYLKQKHQNLNIEKVVNSFLVFMIINSICVIIGYFFEIDFFESYFRGNRFGYSGMLLYHHEIGYVFFIAIMLAYYKLTKKITLFNLLSFSSIFLSSFLFGTKKTVFFSLFFVAFLFVKHLSNYKSVISISSIALVLGLFFRNTLLNIYNAYHEMFYSIYLKDGFWSSFLSHRNNLLIEKYIPYFIDEKGFKSLFFGFPLFNNHRSELEFFDLFLFFGIFGLVAYYFYFKLLLKNKSKTSFFLVLCLLFGSLFSGNLLASANVMTLLILTIYYINQNPKTYEGY
ncbi:MAG: hypothetical protein HKP48_08985 [Winogradskyella sp.]|uniref:hypothetical protein n=1 Tax=Winogradskyella sp. TaxID=1883156 RepID=UPI0017E89CC5|nr:hypothetical protein [Winogradskyella sp.]MBT8243797.1 hypothetical protein [Winogradskyella sp.]NNK23405.1 hypothetical protein [Winogradskyella sp.]